jgi:hypothetical protein
VVELENHGVIFAAFDAALAAKKLADEVAPCEPLQHVFEGELF